jgi:hypothetical protein
MNIKKLIFIAFLVSIAAIAYSQESSPSKVKDERQTESTPKQTESKNKQDNADISPIAVKEVSTNPSNHKKEDHADHHNTGIDWKFIFDVLLVIFNGILAISTWFLWRSTNKLAKSTHVAAISAEEATNALPMLERAYVFVTVLCEGFEIVRDPIKGHEGLFDFRAHIAFRNYGKTPAVINIMRGVICLDEAIIPEIEEVPLPPGFVLGMTSLESSRFLNASPLTRGKI